MGQPVDPDDTAEADLGYRDHRDWVALLGDLNDANRELLWGVGVALLHRMKHDGQAEPSSGVGGTTQP